MENQSKYIKAESGPGRSVIYTDRNGKRWMFKGGNRPWRNHNPGNLVVGNISKRNGAIGVAGGFAVFPSYEIGHAALLDSLKAQHGSKDIDALMRVYAPPHENPTEKYIKFIRKRVNIRDFKKIKDFSSLEFENLWKAIEDMEGWGKHEGTIVLDVEKKKVTGVRKDRKGTIQFYLIDGIGWVSKTEGIGLAAQGTVDAVVATSPKGNKFLRANPNQDALDNLERKG